MVVAKTVLKLHKDFCWRQKQTNKHFSRTFRWRVITPAAFQTDSRLHNQAASFLKDELDVVSGHHPFLHPFPGLAVTQLVLHLLFERADLPVGKMPAPVVLDNAIDQSQEPVPLPTSAVPVGGVVQTDEPIWGGQFPDDGDEGSA